MQSRLRPGLLQEVTLLGLVLMIQDIVGFGGLLV
jgi:hypothetical protein